MSISINGLSQSDSWAHENAFYWFSEPRRINKLLAHWELYKRIKCLPGAVVECGVYKAASLIRWASFRDALETAQARRIYAFDAFGVFPTSDVAGKDDRAFIERFEASGGDGLSLPDVRAILELKGFLNNIELVCGDVRETIPSFLTNNASLRIALLHLDMDVYEPTRHAIDSFANLVVPGGLIVIDDYGTVEGATRAVDEWRAMNRGRTLQKVPFAHVPAFICIE